MAIGYKHANIDGDLHDQITKEAARNKQSFSAQIREYLRKSKEYDKIVDNVC